MVKFKSIIYFDLCVYLFTQEVISALRGTGQEVTLLLCRPEHGVLPEMDASALVSHLIVALLPLSLHLVLRT